MGLGVVVVGNTSLWKNAHWLAHLRNEEVNKRKEMNVRMIFQGFTDFKPRNLLALFVFADF